MASDNEHCGDRGRECTITVSNPVLRGMYPDPSWIWDATREEIVLVNSSFELVPGLPIHTTRDLVTWTHTANAVDEAMSHRLLIDGVEDSGGLYAPTIRRIGGRYVIVCTVARVNEVKALAAGCSQKDVDGCRAAQGNFVIEADELTGPWRGPYWVAGAEGIDPDIFEDGDGTVWWTQTRPALHPQWDGQTEIWTQPIAPGTWTLQDHKTVIWRGYGMDAVWAEGPHLYRVGDYLYLMTAEGGTSFEHSEMIMRTHVRADSRRRSPVLRRTLPRKISGLSRRVTVNEAWWVTITGCLRLANAIRSSHTVIWERGSRSNALGTPICCCIRPSAGCSRVLAYARLRARNPEKRSATVAGKRSWHRSYGSTIRSRGSWTVGSRISVSISSIPVGRSWLRGLAGFPRSWSWTLTRMDCHVQ